MPIDPSMAIKAIAPTPGEWNVGGVGSLDGTPTTGAGAASGTSGNFGQLLTDQLGSLEKSQTDAASASRAMADGTATDPTAAIVAVERAQLSMQLAAQLRTKGVEALQEIFRTQV
ncbi:MAG TPA: flagellar hook-basal body complex protein FliE [Baekduia sp.]|uniref:flagellar hook-basal body complex protein FliE n=1 Tax=Baekduia sp. TaxID=2600305 RepID=UPI002D76F01E|nr:flagellar hook-basal body complex protein FliE [Baekduia sp.]HET6508857.1 flagellar hook-basal body complex protein FliE [Baekduia sp.]